MTLQDKQKIYAALSAPFPEEAIERTDGRVTGKGYSTTGIKYQFLVNRMNEVLGLGGWRVHRSIRTKAITTSKGKAAYESISEITIELGEWIDGQFVAWADAVAEGGHVSVSEPDSVKGSMTNGIKKCLAFFGCGKAAYEGTLDDDNVPAETVLEHGQEGVTVTTLPTSRPQSTPAAPAAQPSAPAAAPQQTRPAAPARNRLSSKQLAAIFAIARKIGYDQPAIRQHIKSTFGVQPEFLNRDQASQIIGALSKSAGNGHAAEYEHTREPGQEG